MRYFFILVASLLLSPVFAQEHNGHDDDSDQGDHRDQHLDFGIPIEERQARDFSRYVLEKLVENGKLDQSWLQAKIEEVTKKKFSEELEWVVLYRNPNEDVVEQNTLYIYLSLFGELLGVDFTGE